MKTVKLLLLTLLLSYNASSMDTGVSFMFFYDLTNGGIPFDTLVIGAIANGAQGEVTGPWKHSDGTMSTSPVPGEGDVYVGYSGELVPLKTLSYGPDDTLAQIGMAKGEVMLNLQGMENSYFYIEASAAGQVVAYSELSSYSDLSVGFTTDENGNWKSNHGYWVPTAHPVPEPSSGLLLLMGGALLGLRRKRRVA